MIVHVLVMGSPPVQGFMGEYDCARRHLAYPVTPCQSDMEKNPTVTEVLLDDCTRKTKLPDFNAAIGQHFTR